MERIWVKYVEAEDIQPPNKLEKYLCSRHIKRIHYKDSSSNETSISKNITLNLSNEDNINN